MLRAREARERAKRRLAQKHEGLDYLRAELALKRSMARLKAATGELRASSYLTYFDTRETWGRQWRLPLYFS